MDPQQSESNGGTQGTKGRALGEKVDRIGDTAQQAWTRTRDAFDDIKGSLDVQGRVDRHPYGTVAAALGVGYLLGGGLFSPLTARIIGFGVRLGMRLAAIPVLRDELFGFVEAMGERGQEGGSEPRGPARGTRQAKSNKEKQP